MHVLGSCQMSSGAGKNEEAVEQEQPQKGINR